MDAKDKTDTSTQVTSSKPPGSNFEIWRETVLAHSADSERLVHEQFSAIEQRINTRINERFDEIMRTFRAELARDRAIWDLRTQVVLLEGKHRRILERVGRIESAVLPKNRRRSDP